MRKAFLIQTAFLTSLDSKSILMATIPSSKLIYVNMSLGGLMAATSIETNHNKHLQSGDARESIILLLKVFVVVEDTRCSCNIIHTQ